MYQANDYEIKEQTSEYVLMEKNTQNIAIHVLLAICFWWILFIPNVLYYFMSVKKKKIIK